MTGPLAMSFSHPSQAGPRTGVRFVRSCRKALGFEVKTRKDLQKPAAKPSDRIDLTVGAGEGNRTLVCSLGSCRSTIELRPQSRCFLLFWRDLGVTVAKVVTPKWRRRARLQASVPSHSNGGGISATRSAVSSAPDFG